MGKLGKWPHAVGNGNLADLIHSGVEIERGEARSALADVGDAAADPCSCRFQ